MTAQGGKYRRDVGTLGVTFLIVNSIIGAGIFGLPEIMHQAVGDFAPWLMLAGSLMVGAVAYCFASLSCLTDRSGGPQRYATDAFGLLVGFEVGWLFYFARMLSQAANVTVLVAYAAAFLPAIGENLATAIAVILVLGAITVVNVVGIRRAVAFLGVLTLFKLLPLIILVIVGVAGASTPGPVELPQLSAVEAIALSALYAFVGFENATIPAGETSNPRRAMPRAIGISLAVVTAVYFGIQYAYSHSSVAGTGVDAPLVALAHERMGQIGALLIGITALVSVLGNLTAGHTTASRITAAMGEDGVLPGWFAAASRWGTPANSIIVFGLGAMAFALTGTFATLIVAATLSRMLVYIVSIAALPRLRRQQGLPWISPGLAVAAPLALVLSLWASFQSTSEQWLTMLAFAFAGTVLFAVASRGSRRKEEA